MTAQERERALATLESSKQALLAALDGVTEAQARWRPAGERWSILEYVEHLAVSDDALVALIERSLQGAPEPESEEERRARERAIRETPAPRGANQAPAGLRPAARFATLAEAVDAFVAARARTMEFARATEADLRSHFAPHALFGKLDGYQWLVANARHVQSHTAHILELREMAFTE